MTFDGGWNLLPVKLLEVVWASERGPVLLPMGGISHLLATPQQTVNRYTMSCTGLCTDTVGIICQQACRILVGSKLPAKWRGCCRARTAIKTASHTCNDGQSYLHFSKLPIWAVTYSGRERYLPFEIAIVSSGLQWHLRVSSVLEGKGSLQVGNFPSLPVLRRSERCASTV